MQVVPIEPSEREFQASVIAAARLRGWLVYHTHDSRRSQPGFPDLVLVRGRQIMFWELKASRGRLTPEQSVWLDALEAVVPDPEVAAAVVRPDDWEWVLEQLHRGARDGPGAG